jgi:hypothetical protein
MHLNIIQSYGHAEPESFKGSLRPTQNKIYTFSQSLVPRFFVQVVFSFGDPCIVLSGPVVLGIMFKYIFRKPIGNWWLLVGIAPIRWAKFSFHVGYPRRFRGELFLIRIYRFEV